MENSTDVVIIGAGVSGVFAALRLAQKHPQTKAILIELGKGVAKRRRFLEGWLGCFPNSDGKLYTGDFDNVLNLTDGRKAKPAYSWVFDLLKEVNPMKLTKDPSPISAVQKKLTAGGFELKTNDHYQWKPESIHALSRLAANEIEKVGNVTFSFDNEVYRISKKKGLFTISASSGDITCKKIILCVGRSGWRWATKLYKELGLSISDDYARIGIRLEMSSSQLKDFNRSHCTLSKDKLEVGPFSWFGTVIPEDHADLVLSTFRSNEERWKTDKVSFSLLASRYFKNSACLEAERLGKLTYLLYNDRVSRERIKLFMKGNSQLCFLPEFSWLKESLEELDSVIPGLIQKGYFHIPDVLPLASPIRVGSNLETELDGLFVAGESSGHRGLMYAAITGCIAGDSACK